MRRSFWAIVLLAGTVGLAWPGGGRAAEALHFSPLPAGSESERAATLLAQTIPEAAALEGLTVRHAVLDLNGDGADEIFLEMALPPGSCAPVCLNRYFLFGGEKGRLFLIGALTGTRLTVSDARTYGVRDIQLFDDPLDDFKSTRHVWQPAERHYAPWSLDSSSLLEDK